MVGAIRLECEQMQNLGNGNTIRLHGANDGTARPRILVPLDVAQKHRIHRSPAILSGRAQYETRSDTPTARG